MGHPCCSLLHGEQGGHGGGAVPEVLETEIFVGGVLVVVVIRDRHRNGVGAGGALHRSQGDAAAHGREKDDLSAVLFGGGGLDRGDDFLGDGQIHGRADGVVAGGVAHDEGHARMGGEDLLGGFGIDDEVALGADVVDDVLLLALPVVADHEAQVDIGCRGGRDDVGGVGAGGSCGEAVDVERRLVEDLEEMAGRILGVAEPEGLHEHGIVVGGTGDGGLFHGRKGHDAVVEVGDEDVAVGVLHAGEELGELHGGVGSPVAVVAAVESVMGAVDGDGEVGVAASAEGDGLRSGLIDGAIADQPDFVALDEVAVGVEDGFKVRGAGFFLAFPDEANVGTEGNVRGSEGVEGGELGKDRGFVVAGRAGVDAGLTIDGVDFRREGRNLPVGGGDGLAVVVGVEDDGVLGAGSADFSKDDGGGFGTSRVGKDLNLGAALAELVEEEGGVAAEAVGGRQRRSAWRGSGRRPG